MGRKTKLSVEQKVNICEQYLDGKKSVKELSQEFDVGVSIIRLWSKMYRANGANGFQPSLHNATYTKEFKQQVVEAYFNGEGTIDDLIIKYEIPSSTTLRKWIEKYNNLEELKDYDPKPEVYMKDRSRKTTLEERIQIVTYCLEHKKNYKEAAELFDVSYTQIYQWVKKYLGAGEEGLIDRRGQHKAEEQLSDNEILKRKVKILERQIREKEMEIDLFKKSSGNRKEAIFSKTKNKAKYLAIQELRKEKNYSIHWMCEKLNIQRSSYYKWLHRTIPENEQEDTELAEIIMGYHERYGGILGYHRMCMFINRDYHKKYNEKRIHRIMKIMNIHSSIRRIRTCCTVVNKANQTAENVLHREFEASKVNEKWTTDVTEFKVPHSTEKIYLSAFLDLYDRSIIVWSISNRNDNALVFDTFQKAIKQYPNAQPLFHSDRGFQYTNLTFQNILKKQGMVQSMSRVACCLDNGTGQQKAYGVLSKPKCIKCTKLIIKKT